jgi:hypothetical protein
MKKGRYWLALSVVLSVFTAGLLIGVGTHKSMAWPFIGGQHLGFFERNFDTCSSSRTCQNVLSGGVNPSNLGTYNASDFVNRINGYLYGNGQDPVGAAFIVLTMLGYDQSQYGNWGSSGWGGVSFARTQFSRWEALVRSYDAAGRANFNAYVSYTINTYYQSGPFDVSWYSQNEAKTWAIVFTSPGGGQYIIKHDCGNPIGDMTGLPVLPPPIDFDITGYTTLAPGDANPKPGDTITFDHYVKNNGPTSTSPTGIWWASWDDSKSTWVGTGGGAVGVMSAGQVSHVAKEEYTVLAGTPPGTKICRIVGWDPVNSEGAHDGRGSPVCATVAYDFSLTPIINPTISSGGDIAEVGDKITFTYLVRNTGLTMSKTATCSIYAKTFAGSHDATNPPAASPPAGWSGGPATGCPRTFPLNATTTLVPETVDATPMNSSVCRSLYVSPESETSNATKGAEVCVKVAAKPYVKTYGGDLSAGGGVETSTTSCAQTAKAGIVGWNTRNANFTGASSQYAAFALSTINDVATTQGGGGAAAPSGLAFGNTVTNIASGVFGGQFSSVPCIHNYYGDKPPTATPIAVDSTSVSLASGSYSKAGNLTITGGSVGASKRINIYVNGNVYISGPINF